MVSRQIEALRTLLDYVKHTTNLDDRMLGEIDSAVKVLDNYLTQFEI